MTATNPAGSLRWRLLLSAILIPGFAGLFYLDHSAGPRAAWLLGLCLLLALRATWELAGMLGRVESPEPRVESQTTPPLAASSSQLSTLNSQLFSGSRLSTLDSRLTAFCAAVVVGAGWCHQWCAGPSSSPATIGALGPPMLAFAFALLVLFVNRMLRYRGPGGNLETLAAEIFIVAYVGLLIAVTAQLRWVAGAQAGYLALGSLVIAVKAGDIGAYTLGRLFGRRKMTPLLSPGKTWMGAFGALLASGLASVAWLRWATPLFDAAWQPSAWYWALLYGVILGTVGLIGDLAESLIKRDVGAKDASALMPGFGGLLDLLDSVLYAGPVAYLLWLVLPLVR